MKALVTSLLFLLTLVVSGQDMRRGFDFLEQGEYVEALVYFKGILDDYPDNRTARLCFGRALGLSGKTAVAKQHFVQLLQEYPNDLEIKLNHAESLLWNKDYKEALPVYEALAAANPKHFVVVLGYANTLSQLKEYDAAIVQIENALRLQPQNENARVSFKYIRLGKAAQLIQENYYAQALRLLEMNLEDFPGDRDTQLTRINCFLLQNDFNAAAEGYRSLEDSIASLTGLSLVAHKLRKNKIALQLAGKAKIIAQSDTNSFKKIAAGERWVQALLWNRKYGLAGKELQLLEELYGGHVKILGLRATYEMYRGRLEKSRQAYEEILSVDSTSFDGNLGMANAYFGMGERSKAVLYARQTLKLYPNQKDAIDLINKIETQISPVVTNNTSYSRDNGKNEAWMTSTNAEIPFSERLSAGVGYMYRNTKNTISNEMAYTTQAQLRARYRIINNTIVEGNLSFIKTEAANSNYQNTNGGISLSTRPLPLHFLKLGYQRELQSFNAALLDEKIFMDNFNISYNMGTNIGLGWYSSYTFTSQTDNNTRNLLFTSVYYNLSEAPLWKAGLNYQYLGFKEQVPSLYFSPSKYQALEVFTEISGGRASWIYSLQAAAGLQYVEKNTPTSLFRFEGNLDHNITNRLRLGVFGRYSTIASETATGFEYMEVGIKLRWQFSKKPLFRKSKVN